MLNAPFKHTEHLGVDHILDAELKVALTAQEPKIPFEVVVEALNSYAGSQEEKLNSDLHSKEMEIQKLKAEKAALKTALSMFMDIVDESSGVAGFHLNGDVALWSEFSDELNFISSQTIK